MATTIERRRGGGADRHAGPTGDEQPDQLSRTWRDPGGWRKWFVTVQNQNIGILFISTTFAFFVIGGIQALLMRVQLAVPENTFVDPRTYNQLFTVHGTTMMFLFAVPIMEAFANLLLPPLLGARELPFPRMTAFGYWSFLFGGLFFYSSYLFGAVPDGGWFAYVPLTGPIYSPGLAIDFWLLGLSVAEVAAMGAGIELVVAILKMRAPGMSIGRMPLFAWSILVMGVSIIFAFTPLLVGTTFLELERKFGTRFFDPAAGGDPLLWQHLFWIFGHPEVYIQFIPATGMVSMIVATFARRPIVGYTLIALSVVATGFLSFGLWVHHMFAVGLALLALSFFTGASMTIAIPSGVQIFSWIATIWAGRPVFRVPFLFVVGFILNFVLGGLTGVMVASVPFDRQIHDTYFVVAHFHYVLIGGVVFPIFGALYYWMPLLTGRLLNEQLGRWNFWLIFIGFNVTFFPMHVTGLLGMPRRYYTYAAGLGWDWLNLLSTIGAFILALGVVVFIWNVVHSVLMKRGEWGGDDPWGSGTLDWAPGAPAPDEGYRVIPIVRSRYPMWEQERLDVGTPREERIVHGLAERPATWRAALVTSPVDARPEAITRMSTPSWWPFAFSVALTVLFAGTLFDRLELIALGTLASMVSVFGWLWPSRQERDLPELDPDGTVHGLPVYASGPTAVGWWGMALTCLIFAVAFASLYFSYFYLRAAVPEWPPAGVPLPDLRFPAINTGLLGLCALAMLWAERSVRRGSGGGLKLGLAASLVLAAGFLGVQAYEFAQLGFGATSHAYGSIFYTIAGTVTTLVIGAVLMSLYVQVQAWLGYFNARRFLAVQNTALYVYFLFAAWLTAAAVLYLGPRLV